jgi:hypothetical protein
MATRRSRLSRTTFAAAAAAVLVLLSGCSSSSGDDGGGSASDSVVVSREGNAQAGDSGGSAESASLTDADSPAKTDPALQEQKVISTGNVQLRADDVGQAIFEVRKVVDEYGGTISEDDTETDDDGHALRSRMVLRIPTQEFGDAMAELEKVATLASSKRQTVDVTTEVLDMDVRVEAQRRSIDRIQVLFDNATSIKDVMSIENELSRRQADLASLEAQQRYLADQTAMSTITLSLERTAKAQPKPDPDTHDTGFLAGLSGGWNALEGFLVAAATVAGALLPWLVLVILLAIPGWPLARRLSRRQSRGQVAAT